MAAKAAAEALKKLGGSGGAPGPMGGIVKALVTLGLGAGAVAAA